MHIPYTLPHRFHRWLARITPAVLNIRADVSPSPAPHLLTALYANMDAIKTQAFDLTTGNVKYHHLRESSEYQHYRHLTAALPAFDLSSLATQADKLAFWINLYNLLTIDIVIHYGVEADINEVNGVFYRAGYNIGGMFFALHDIEQGILRANQGHPAIPGAQFARHDPRHQHSLNQLDPRTHFALVCAAESCPPINYYTAEAIDAQLDMASINFINSSEVQIDRATKTATLSKIFQWYAPDFGAAFAVTLGFGDARPILAWLAPYLSDKTLADMLQADPAAFTVRFKSYDWSLNAL